MGNQNRAVVETDSVAWFRSGLRGGTTSIGLWVSLGNEPFLLAHDALKTANV